MVFVLDCVKNMILGSGLIIKRNFKLDPSYEVLDSHLKYKIHKDLTFKGMRSLKRLVVKLGETNCLKVTTNTKSYFWDLKLWSRRFGS